MKKKNEKPNDMQTALDCAIRDYEHNKEAGYIIKDTQYFNYICNQEWEKYLNDMKPCHKNQYGMGAGGELKEGKYPPKMASFGSSSRLIYELSKDIDGFIFEEKLDTRVGGTAHLDGFLRKGCDYIYIEAKRREIYGSSHENEEIKSVYEPVYKKIKEVCGSHFDYHSVECKTKKEDTKKVTFIVNGKSVKYFDLKQLICHFLGITYDIAKHPVSKAKVTFLYLLYDPKNLKKYLANSYCEKIMERHEIVVDFINKNISLFKEIFQAVLLYQIETHKLDRPDIDFEFKLVDKEEEFKTGLK